MLVAVRPPPDVSLTSFTLTVTWLVCTFASTMPKMIVVVLPGQV